MLSVVILAAGHGSRMQGTVPKVVQPIAGQPMLKRVHDLAKTFQPSEIFVVVGPDASALQAICPDTDVRWIVQPAPCGTGDAVKHVMPHLPSTAHPVLVLYGDVPFACATQLKCLIDQVGCTGFGVVTTTPPNPDHMGRIVRAEDGTLQKIVEHVDATLEQRTISEVFSGMMVAPSDFLQEALLRLQPNNQQQEYYLTDLLADWLDVRQQPVATVMMQPWWHAQGVNTMAEMAALERRYQCDQAAQWMAKGVRIVDPQRFDCRGNLEVGQGVSVDINAVLEGHVRLGHHVRIDPNVTLRNVVVGDGCHIKANSVISDSVLEANVTVGPFAYIRPGTVLENRAKVGCFVELKNTKLGAHSKANHLSYLGDCEVGRGVNIGAGFISCNYDGTEKHKTIIEDYCFVGAGCQMVAPIHVEKGVMVGAATCLRGDVKAGTLVVDRGKVAHIQNWPKLGEWVAKQQKEVIKNV